MNIYYVTYCLSRACLGEISENFLRIYWRFESKYSITLYFYMEKVIEDDVDGIFEEILPMLEIYLIDYFDLKFEKINCQIFYNNEYMDHHTNGDFIEFYRKKINL